MWFAFFVPCAAWNSTNALLISHAPIYANYLTSGAGDAERVGLIERYVLHWVICVGILGGWSSCACVGWVRVHRVKVVKESP